MAKAAQKITLSPSRDIPFDKLVLSQSNVRRIKAGVSVEELAEDIARRGMLQGLNVRPMLDADGVETGMFEIPAGGRRFQALSLLVKQKRLAKSAPIPCIVRDAASEILAADDSLAENMQRVALHPLDQFRAFQALREKGQGEEAIAAAFFVTPQIVKQRLKLASAAPALLEVYAEDGMTLEQLMAFTVNPDHARQVQVWDAVKNSWNKEPYAIRRMLTETSVRASDRRAVFVGVDAYEAAGGVVLRDLFQGDDGGWLEDPALLDRLVAAKLQAETEALVSEGWKWIEVATDLPYGYSHGLRRLAGDPAPMSDEESAAHAALLSQEAIKRIEAKALAKLRQEKPKTLRSFLDMDDGDLPLRRAFDIGALRAIAEGIDWETQVNRFLSGDFSGLLAEEAAALEALAAHAGIVAVLVATSQPPKQLLLACLAKQFVTHSRAAQRFAIKVLSPLGGRDIASEFFDQINQ